MGCYILGTHLVFWITPRFISRFLPRVPLSLPLSFITNIDLYIPDSVSITVLPQILTTDGDSASLFGYNTSAVLRVLLVYGSSAVDASNAPFTVVVIQNPNLLSRVKTDLGTLLETKHTTGQTQIVVSSPLALNDEIDFNPSC